MLRGIGLTKDYGETKALRGLDLSAEPGQILGIAGPNGAGKSTLIRLLAGEEAPSGGTICLGGKRRTAAELSRQVAVVHQEARLFGNLTVEQNLLVGREGTRMRRPRLSDEDRELLVTLELSGWAGRRLADCPLAIQQRAEIARALARGADVLLLDEPNSALTEDESERFFERVRAIAAAGRIVLLVTHRLTELVANSGRVIVIRDGVRAAELTGSELDEEAVARELVVEAADAGSAVGRRRREGARDAGGGGLPVVRLRDWKSRRGDFDVPALDVEAGEVVAIVGVEGSGARELVRSVASQAPARGTLEIAPAGADRRRAGVAEYVPASRADSLFENLSIARNVVARLDRAALTRAGTYLDRGRIGRRAGAAAMTFGVRGAPIDQPIGALSGGNQQKVAIAAALAPEPALLVAEEPTRGVDVGSKVEIYGILRAYVRDGNAVLLFCTEVTEVFDVADRVFVMDRGSLSDELLVGEHDNVDDLAVQVAARERHTVRPAVA